MPLTTSRRRSPDWTRFRAAPDSLYSPMREKPTRGADLPAQAVHEAPLPGWDLSRLSISEGLWQWQGPDSYKGTSAVMGSVKFRVSPPMPRVFGAGVRPTSGRDATRSGNRVLAMSALSGRWPVRPADYLERRSRSKERRSPLVRRPRRTEARPLVDLSDLHPAELSDFGPALTCAISVSTACTRRTHKRTQQLFVPSAAFRDAGRRQRKPEASTNSNGRHARRPLL